MPSKAPTLADTLINVMSRRLNRSIDPAQWVPRTIASARKFVLDKAMSAFNADLAYAVFPFRNGDPLSTVNPKRNHQILENMRTSARLPHKVTWIEFDLTARLNRARSYYNDSMAPIADEQTCGWLMLQHPQVDTAFMAVECVSHTVLTGYDPDEPLVPLPSACPLAYVWTVDDSLPPWPMMGQAAGHHHYASALLTGFEGYEVPQVGWAISPWVTPYDIKTKLTQKYFSYMQKELASDLRYLWALLGAINDTPVSYRAVTPTKGHMVRGQYKKFSAHTTITLQVPHKMTTMQLAKRVARAARRRAHQVRGHFRKDWRHPGQKLWVHEHQRGDASLGFVLHDYQVEHPV